MPTREESELKERADRALRSSRPSEALSLYRALLRRVTVFEPGLYESWLEGALAAYQALGRTREAGYVLFTLRRFALTKRSASTGVNVSAKTSEVSSATDIVSASERKNTRSCWA